ncbi:MAG: type II toxin-antitoxin system RelE/ParE family toxin [Nitrospinae bacterium]|nr:type II toxin-antitoxin system RelE/ParE family toxin [Nitrospinota bacterium]
MKTIRWSPLAIECLEEIVLYAFKKEPLKAIEWIDSLFDKVSLLKRNFRARPMVPELELTNVRQIVHGDYRVIYQFDDTLISILSVRRCFKQFGENDVHSDTEKDVNNI